MKRQQEYRVVWEVDVCAASPREAAEAAAEIQRDQTVEGCLRGFFEVRDESGEMTIVDFEEDGTEVPAVALEAWEVEITEGAGG